MVLITGGAYQGKTEFAKKHFGLAENEIADGAVCGADEVFNAVAVKNFHLLIKRIIPETEAAEFAKRLCAENPSAVIISTEIGGGIIPLERSERLWREECGRACCVIAEFSEKVIRLNCGIPTAVKGVL